MDSEDYYLAKRCRKLNMAILALVIAIAAGAWATVSAMCGHPVFCIALAVIAVFAAFVSAVQFMDANEAHNRWLRAVVEPQPAPKDQ